MANASFKKCPSCKQDLPSSKFWKARANPDGLYGYCIPCGRDKARKPPPIVTELPGEEWLPVAGWESLYCVSNFGRVKTLERLVPFRNRWGETSKQRRPGRILRLAATEFGHLAVNLTSGSKRKRVLVHRLVCEAFNGPCPSDKQHCAHWDGDPTNNRPENLRWATVAENAADTKRHGNLRQGEQSNLSRLCEAEVLEIREKAKRGASAKALAKEYRMTDVGIRKIINRENWKHI